MSQVAYKEAKERLGSLMSQAAKGEEVIIEREDGRQFLLVELKKTKPRPVFGSAKGEIRMLEGFEDPIPMTCSKEVNHGIARTPQCSSAPS